MTQLIYSKMLEAQRLFGRGGIEKKDRNKFQNFNYRSVDSTIAAANTIFAEVGIFCIPSASNSEWSVRDVKDKSDKPRTDYTLRTEYNFTFYAEDGSSVVVSGIPCANSSQDDSKLLGQTLSYAYKECLFKTFSIPVEGNEDVDALDANRNQRAGGSEGYPLRAPETLSHRLEEESGELPMNFPKPPEATKRWLARKDSNKLATSEDVDNDLGF